MTKPAKSVLFTCNMNSVRSPIAAAMFAAYCKNVERVDSAGVYSGWLDPMTSRVLAEVDIVLDNYKAKKISDVNPDDFDLIIAMTPEAAGEIRRIVPAEKLEYWDIDNPTSYSSEDNAVLQGYREVRDDIEVRIKARFHKMCQKA